MDTVDLPIFSAAVTVDDALRDLRTNYRSGLVLEVPSGQLLLHAGDILKARAKGIATLGEITGGYPVVSIDSNQAAHFNLDLADPMSTRLQYANFFKSVGHRYALVGKAGGRATIVTSSEKYVLSLRLTGGYECDGTPTHYFPEPRVSDGEDCPLYPQCSRPDGGIPKIRPAA